MAPVLEDPGLSLFEAEAVSDHKSRDSSKISRKSEKRKVPGPVHCRFNTASDYSTYRLVGRISLYVDQDVKRVARWASRFQVLMKAQIFVFDGHL